MSTTIDSLDIQITTSAGDSAARIEELARALGNLKNNAKITVVVNGLQKLANTLYSLNPAIRQLDTNKLSDLAQAMNGLASVQRLSGLGSALNTLSRLPAIVNALDAADLVRFATQMQNLANAMAPLARQINVISQGFAGLPANIVQAINAINNMTNATNQATVATQRQGQAINATGLNVMTLISNIHSLIQVFNLLGDILTATIGQAMEWDGIQYRFGRSFGEDAEKVYDHLQRINEAMGLNVQEMMQYSSMYGALLSGFGLSQEKTTTISVGLMELTYDLWAANNDVIKNYEDVATAVKSAITGEIEPIRNLGISLTEASLQEYLDNIGMAHINYEKLAEAQKAEVRYAAMVNAAMQQGVIGTYANEMHTAEGAVRNLSQAFKGLVQAFGSLFIPILQIAIPYLTAFINLLYEAVAAIAAFFGVTLFKIDWSGTNSGVGDMASGLKDAANSAGGVGGGLSDAADAAKKIKDYTMGFDELNVISPPKDSGSGGGGGGGGGGAGDWGEGLDLETLWDESIFAKASQQVDELKQKITEWFEEWKTEIGIIAAALAAISVANLLTQLGTALGLSEKFLTSMTNIKKLAATAIILTIQWSLMSEFLENFIEEGEWESYVWAAITGALGAFGSYLTMGKTGLILSLTITAITSLKATFADGSVDSSEEATTGLTGIVAAVAAIGLAWKTYGPAIVSAFNVIRAFFGAVMGNTAAQSALSMIAPSLAPVASALSSAASAVGSFIAGITAPAWAVIAAIIAAVASVVLFLYRNWEKVVAAVKKFFKEKIAPKLEKIKEHWDELVETVRPAIDLFKKAKERVGEIAEKFSEWWEKVEPLRVALDAVLKVFEGLGGVIFAVGGGLIAGVINMLVGIADSLIQIFTDVTRTIGDIYNFVVALFSGEGIEEAWDKIWTDVVEVVSGIWELVYTPIKDFVDGIIEFFVDLWDELVGHSIVPDTIDSIVEWFCSLPDKIWGAVQEFVDGIVLKFEGMWDDIKLWYNTNVAPKFTKAYWQGVFDNVITGISTKLSELKGEISDKWDGVVEWYNENVAPKLTVEYWSEKIASFIDVGKEIVENIKEGLSEKWEELVQWWEDLELPEFQIKKPHLSWGSKPASGWIADTLEALGLPTKIPDLKVEWYAQGGFPGMGELFVAREAGPELVGRIGNRSAVANNDQIVAAVSQGVYGAVVAAMSASGGNSGQSINVYLDGKQIYTSVKKVEAERGVSIMGNQLGYAY